MGCPGSLHIRMALVAQNVVYGQCKSREIKRRKTIWP